MANIPLQYPFPYKTINSTGFTSSVEFVNVTVLGDVTIDQNLTVSGIITTTDLTVGDDLTVGGQIDAKVLRAFGIWDTPIQTVDGAGAWIGFDSLGHTIFANRKSTAGQTNSFRWYAYTETNAFQGELMRLSNAGNLFVSGTRIEFPLVHFNQPPGTFPFYDFILPSSMGSAGQVLTSAGVGNPTYWTTPSGGGGGGGTVTNVTGTSPVTVTSPSTTPNISLSTIPTTLGGTGLTTVGTNGQVLSSNGTTLQYVTLPTPVTNVTASSPLSSSGGSTPDISIGSSTGTGAVVLQNDPVITTGLTIAGTTFSAGYIRSGTLGVGSGSNISDLYLTQVGLGGGYVNQYIHAAYNATNGYYISVNTADDFVINTNSTEKMVVKTGGNVGIGTTTPLYKLTVSGDDSVPADLAGAFSVQATTDNNQRLHMGYATVGDYGWIEAVKVGSNLQPLILNPRGGNVGIGTTTPAQKLHVNNGRLRISDTNDAVFEMISASYTNYIYTASANGNLIMDLSNRDYLIYTRKLWVLDTAPGGFEKGTINFYDDNHAIMGRYDNNDANVGSMNYYAYGEHRFLNDGLLAAQTLKMTITTGGNVGIGTATPSSKLQVNGTARATNFTTNGSNTFTYASGTFTPRIAMYYTSDFKVYECNSPPAGRDSMAITYTVQSGVWVRVGNLITVNAEVQYSQTYAGIFFSLTNLNIVMVLPEAACAPAVLGAVGMSGFPSRIQDRFVDNKQFNYLISNESYAPGGLITTVLMYRDNTHDPMPWDPVSKGGQRVNITISYYVNQ